MIDAPSPSIFSTIANVNSKRSRKSTFSIETTMAKPIFVIVNLLQVQKCPHNRPGSCRSCVCRWLKTDRILCTLKHRQDGPAVCWVFPVHCSHRVYLRRFREPTGQRAASDLSNHSLKCNSAVQDRKEGKRRTSDHAPDVAESFIHPLAERDGYPTRGIKGKSDVVKHIADFEIGD